jgi:hypothetical protein
MNDLERLIAIEEIKRIKARYWRGVDMKDPMVLRDVFADDAKIDFRGNELDEASANQPLPTPDEFVAGAMQTLAHFVTAHHGHAPDIEFLSDTEAVGYWPMEDNIWVKPGAPNVTFTQLRGYGIYHDRYCKTPRGWRISETMLMRIKVETTSA